MSYESIFGAVPVKDAEQILYGAMEGIFEANALDRKADEMMHDVDNPNSPLVFGASDLMRRADIVRRQALDSIGGGQTMGAISRAIDALNAESGEDMRQVQTAFLCKLAK